MLLNARLFGDFGLSTLICWRSTRISASSRALDRNSPVSAHPSSKRKSIIVHEHHPIRPSAPPVWGFRQGQYSPHWRQSGSRHSCIAHSRIKWAAQTALRCTKNKSAQSSLVLLHQRRGARPSALPGRAVPVTGCPLGIGTVLKHLGATCHGLTGKFSVNWADRTLLPPVSVLRIGTAWTCQKIRNVDRRIFARLLFRILAIVVCVMTRRVLPWSE